MIIDSTVALSQLWVTYCSVRLSILITSRGATINGSVNRKKNDALFIVFNFFYTKICQTLAGSRILNVRICCFT